MKNIDDYLFRCYKYFTYDEMAADLNVSRSSVYDRCRYLGIRAISPSERLYQFILARYKKRTVADLAKLVDMTEPQLRHYYCMHNLTPYIKSTSPIVTPAKILSEYKKGVEIDYSKEYYDKCLKKAIQERGIENIPIE